jgi:MATE family multidrug resistance protein
MFITFFSYLLIGIPASYIFAFLFHSGPVGIWYGYLLGLGMAGVLFFLRFKQNLKTMTKKTGYLSY